MCVCVGGKHIGVCVSAHMFSIGCTYVHVCVYVCMDVCTCMCMYAWMCVYMYVCMYAWMCVCDKKSLHYDIHYTCMNGMYYMHA